MRVTYRIGVRGRMTDVLAFTEKMDTFRDYYRAESSNPSNTVYEGARWLEGSGTLEFHKQVESWTEQWSAKFDMSEAYYVITEPNPGTTVIRTGRFVEGKRTEGFTISSHQAYEEVLPKYGMESRCRCASRWTQDNPTSAPFADCPIRLNPPTAWAVENIMNAMDNLPVQRRY